MLTLSNGYKKPQTGDTGSVFFPALEDNIQRLNDHTHDGLNSVKLTSLASNTVTASVAAASWVAVGDVYRQLITLPVGFNYNNIVVGYRLTATGEPAYLKTEYVTDNTYYVYCNDNTKTFTAVYSS